MFLNAFKNLFTPKTTKIALKKGIRRRLELLGLEERVVPATFTVINNSDLGAGSLREAITLANTTAGDDTIDFIFASGTSPYTITLASALPNIIDANTVVGAGTAGTVTITGLGASSLIIDGSQGGFNIFRINTGGNLTISGVTVSGANISGNGSAFNNLGGNGGAFNNSGTLFVSNSTISGNTADCGGGIINNGTGTVTVTNSTISNNTASVYGGGIFADGNLTVTNSTISGNTASKTNSGTINTTGTLYVGAGGGLYLNLATAIISNSTISGNTASFTNTGSLTANTVFAGNGGGISIYNSTVTLSNSTISGNSASFTNSGTLNNANFYLGYGGGIMFNQGTLNVTNSTISGNSAATALGNSIPPTFVGGGIYNRATLNIANTIIANSTDGASTPALIDDYDGTGTVNLTSPSTAANNLLSTGTFSWATTKTSAEINLGTLANNGGPTKTIALGTGSVAIGAGDATISNAAPVNGLDQRGVTRSTTAPSIGAFEFYPATQVTLTTTASGSASGSAFTTQPVITIKDSLGNPVNTTASVTMTVSGNGTTVGTTTINAVNGVATFTNVGISGTAGTAYTLTFTSGSLTTATQSITPTFGLATQVALSTSAAGSASGSAFTTQPVITILDAFGNTVTNSTASVTMTVSGNGTTLGTTTVNAVAGVATFTDVGISGTAGTAYTLTFASNGLTSATQSITPTFGAATQATLTTNAAGSASGSAFTTQPVVTIQDAFGNTVTNSTASVTMTVSTGATTVGTTTINAVNGVATFTNVGISGTAGTAYTLTFASAGLTSATQFIATNFSVPILVTNNADSGTGSLRNAITLANNTAGDDIIDFAFSSGTSPYTITLTASALPTIKSASISGTLTINGLGASALTISGDNGVSSRDFNIFNINSGGNLSISGVTVSGAKFNGSGGAFNNSGTLNISNSVISGNTSARRGGAILNYYGTLAVNNSTLSGNTSASGGGAIFNYYGTLAVNNSTLSGNSAIFGGGIAIYYGKITVSNSTISGNTANNSGGGINNYEGTLTVTNSTFSGNSSTTGGGIYNFGILNIANTIIANSTSGGDYAGSNNATVNLTSPSTAANNLVSQGSFSWATTKTSAEINLGPLQNNGGPTQTLALLNGSVAIATGNATISNAAPINGLDQRGVSRSSTAPSIGAYEAPTPSTTAPLVVGTPPPTSSCGSSTVTLYDPITGEPTGTAVPFPGFSGPVKVVSGDFNNDGVAEIFAGAGFGGGPAIAILNSQTGEVMESFFAFDPAFTGGVFVAVQDVNNDGILDIIASAGPGGGPEVRIFDGNGLTVLRSFYAYAVDFTGGVSVASIDFNNDGILDLVTGAGPGGAPHVKVFDGATNAIISQWYAYATDFTGGVFVAVGDIGNDGAFEVVTGAGAGGSPVVAVWDPNTGALLAQFMAYAEDFTGGVRVGINDGNSDGIADILTGAGPGGGPQVNVFSFPALDLLFSFYSGDPANTGGVFVS